MNRVQDMALRKVLDITLEKLKDMNSSSDRSSFFKSQFFSSLVVTLCNGVKTSNLTDNTYALIDKLCLEFASDDDLKIIEHILLDGVDFNRLTGSTLIYIGHMFYSDA